jgi:hypothetical protein
MPRNPSLLCRLGIHARVAAVEPSIIRHDLYRCRRCPAQWRIGSYPLGWGTVRYRDRLADAPGPYDHAAAAEAEAGEAQAWARWRP